MKTSNCGICNSTSARAIQKIAEFTIVKCNGCGLVYYIPVLSKSELSAYYDSSYYSREKQVSADHNYICNLRLDILNEIVSFHSKPYIFLLWNRKRLVRQSVSSHTGTVCSKEMMNGLSLRSVWRSQRSVNVLPLTPVLFLT